MNDSISQELLLSTINSLLDETFESVQGIYLDKGTSLFETLKEIGAEEASIPVSEKCASIAAQVKHVNFYLEQLERYMFTRDQFKADWGEIWRTTREVTLEQWETLKSQLNETYHHLRERLKTVEDWNDDRPIGGTLAIIVHTAYHLGEIRQATCIVKS